MTLAIVLTAILGVGLAVALYAMFPDGVERWIDRAVRARSVLLAVFAALGFIVLMRTGNWLAMLMAVGIVVYLTWTVLIRREEDFGV